MQKPIISIIAALSENRVIGNKGKIPWHIRTDLIRFKHKTTGHVTIFGRKTLDSYLAYYERSGRPFPNRTNIVITHDPHFKITTPHTYVAHSLPEAIDLGKKYETEEIFVAGGGQIFQEAIPVADRLYLTIVHKNFDGDTFFPDYSEFRKIIHQEDGEENGLKYTFLDLTK